MIIWFMQYHNILFLFILSVIIRQEWGSPSYAALYEASCCLWNMSKVREYGLRIRCPSAHTSCFIHLLTIDFLSSWLFESGCLRGSLSVVYMLCFALFLTGKVGHRVEITDKRTQTHTPSHSLHAVCLNSGAWHVGSCRPPVTGCITLGPGFLALAAVTSGRLKSVLS